MTADQLESAVKALPIQLPIEACTWWSWHDGGPIHMGPEFTFFSLSEAVRRYSEV